MIDNGAAGNIFIPTFLISKTDGDLIQKFISNSTYTRHVALSLTFEIPHNGNRISYSLWMSAENKLVYDFLHEFALVGSGISKKKATFEPHYVTVYCILCSIEGFTRPEKDCLSGGRYCAADPDGDGPNTGRDIVYENLRQLCVYRQTESKDDYAIWFNYVKYYNELCAGEITDVCIEEAMKRAKVNINTVKNCMKESFIGQDQLIADNHLLKEQRNAWALYEVSYYPALVVNNQTYRGD